MTQQNQATPIKPGLEKCKKCGQWGWGRSHKCPPTWMVYWVGGDYLAAPSTIVAATAEAAAVACVRQMDNDTAGEYGFATGETTPTMMVLTVDEYKDVLGIYPDRDPDEIDWNKIGSGVKYQVSGEYVPSFSARKVF